MFLYVTTGESTDREVTPLRSVPETVGRLYLAAMREHDRRAVLRHRSGSRWVDTPDWRFDRHVIRTALYLVERWDLEAGDRIAVLSEDRPEALLVELAAACLGAIHIPLDSALAPAEMTAILREAAPRFVFASDASAAQKLLELRGSAPAPERICVFETSAAAEGAVPLATMLDHGATLDTPERASAFRRRAGQVEPPDLLTLLYRPGRDGRPAGIALTHGDLMAGLRRFYRVHPARKGDTGCFLLPPWSPAGRLARLAFIGDGYTTTVLPARGPRLWDELREARPAKLVADPAFLGALLERAREQARKEGELHVLERVLAGMPARGNGWRGSARRLLGLVGGSRKPLRRLADEPLGGAVRWIAVEPEPPEPVSRFLSACGLPAMTWFGIPDLATVLGGQRGDLGLEGPGAAQAGSPTSGRGGDGRPSSARDGP